MPGELRGLEWTYNHVIVTGVCDGLRLPISVWNMFELDQLRHTIMIVYGSEVEQSKPQNQTRGQRMRIGKN